MITPEQSQIWGLKLSLMLFVLTLGFSFILSSLFGLWYLGLVGGFVGGSYLGFQLYTTSQLAIDDPNWVALATFLGRYTGEMYTAGYHFVLKGFAGLRPFPGPHVVFAWPLTGLEATAKDGSTVLIGKIEKGPLNAFKGSIIDPLLYSRAQNPDELIDETYRAAERLIVGEADHAFGVVEEQTLIETYLMLPPLTGEIDDVLLSRAAHTRFEQLLTSITPLYSERSIAIIMARAGLLQKDLLEIGIQLRGVYLP